MGTLILKKGREKSLLNRHPWVFSGAVAHKQGAVRRGEVVEVMDAAGNFLGRGYYNDRSQIVVRILTFQEEEEIDEAFFARRLEAALRLRRTLLNNEGTTAYRLVFAESDRLPGLVVDRYADFLVVQFLTLGIEQWRETILDWLEWRLQPRGIYERSEAEAREVYEGLSRRVGRVRGEEPPELVEIKEHGYRFWVDVRQGQKTGFYLDQRDNRAQVAKYCPGQEVLNAFSYTGGFGLYAHGVGARRVVHVDSSQAVLDLARRNLESNGFPAETDEYLAENVFEVLRRFREQGRHFDVIILDPPKFAATRSQLEKATRGYKDLNMNALHLLRPGGILATFSCSGAVNADLFQKIVFGASVDAGREVHILERCAQPGDHPVLLSFPEGEYLKGLICRVME